MNAEPGLRILILEDHDVDADLVVHGLRAEGLRFEHQWVQSGAQFKRALSEFKPHLVLCDYNLPGFSGVEALRLALERCPGAPVIFVSGAIGEEKALDLLKSGVTDLVLKSRLERLGPAVRRALQEQQAEAQIREQADLLSLVPDAIISRDLEHRVRFWSQGAERTYGWNTQEVLGKSVNEFLYRDPKLFEAAEAELHRRGEWSAELVQHAKSGREVTVHSRWYLLRDTDGQPRSVLAIDTDITERKALESQLLRMQRLESIGRLAGGIAHDLNNILAPILISTPMLRWGLAPEQSAKILGAIETSAQRGADLVKQLMIFGRGIEGCKSLIQPKALISQMARMIRETFPKDIVLQLHLENHLWPVLGDPTQLHQVLLNLCVNARDAMPKGGHLVISAAKAPLDEEYARLNPEATPGTYLLLQIADTGHGIAPELLERIFEPFFTTKEEGKGTGLGLSTVLGIVKSHRGFLTVESKPGEGTVFRIYLPATPEAREAPPDTAITVALPRGRGELVLVVDDEPPICELTAQILQQSGYEVITAADGVEAVMTLARQPARAKLVLTDLVMPEMDGLTLIRVLKRMDSTLRFIAMSGGGGEKNQEKRTAELAALGVPTLLHKPYTAEQLLTACHKLLHPEEPPPAAPKNGRRLARKELTEAHAPV